MNEETIRLQLLSMVLNHAFELRDGGLGVQEVIDAVKRLEVELFPQKDNTTF